MITNYDLVLGHIPNKYVTNGVRKSDLTLFMMDKEADMITLFVSHEIESFTLLKFGQISINMSKSKAANSDFHGLQSSRYAMNKNQI